VTRQARTRRRAARAVPGLTWPLAAMTAGLALTVTAAVGLHTDRAAPTGFALTRPGLANPATALPRGGLTSKGLAVTGPAAPAAPAVPVRLSLPTLGVSALVQDEVTTQGVLGVPPDPAQVGWWTGSDRPGSPTGSTVLDGHVDSARTGASALYRLTELRAGDPIVVSDAQGRDVTYRVYARQVYPKHRGLPGSLFTATGPPRLVLITCGGPFDGTARSYQGNVANQGNVVVLAAQA